MRTLFRCIDWTNFWAFAFFVATVQIWLVPLVPNDWRSGLAGAGMGILFQIIWPIFRDPPQ